MPYPDSPTLSDVLYVRNNYELRNADPSGKAMVAIKQRGTQRGRIYYWDAGSTSPDNGTTIIRSMVRNTKLGPGVWRQALYSRPL
jgi:hypothetical protein